MKKYQNANPKYADFFAKFVNFDEDYNFYRALIVSADWVRTKKDPLALSRLYETQSKNMGLPEDANLGEAFKSFADELLKNDMIANVYNLSGLHAGDHIAERSGAMTDVAKALGFSELLAGSKRAVVERGGEQIHGVMMEPAALDSVDVQYLTKDSSILKVDPKEFDSKVMLSSLADLQIIDYLCANTDRHANNFFVRQDASDADHPKLVGVVGIDNDNSFGDINDGGVLKLAKSDELKIITPKMADAISSMTDKRLHEILDEYNLSENEIKSAEKRLATLKDMISAGRKSNELKFEKGELVNEKGTIHIVKDDEWDSLTLNSLVPQSVAKIQANGNKIMEKNLFYIAAYRRNDIAERAKKLNMDNPPEEVKTKDPIVYTTHKVQMNFDKISLEQENELNQLSKIVNGLSGYGADESGRSAKFKDMWNKLNSFISDYVALKQSTKSDDVEPGMRTKEQELKERYKSLNKKRDILAESIDRYLNKKHFKLSITERNQHRIDLAVKLADFVKAPPQSQVYLENETVKMEQHKAQFNSKTVHQLNSYVTNQIYSKMRDTLRNNVQALPDGDKKRGLGINAIRAHERLWKYGQTDGVSHKDNSNKDEKTRERVSINQLNDEVKREAKGKTDIDQICNDLNTLVKYEPKLGEKIKNMVENKSKITPRQVKGVLQDLLVIGSEKRDMQKTEVKEKTVKVVRKKK